MAAAELPVPVGVGAFWMNASLMRAVVGAPHAGSGLDTEPSLRDVSTAYVMRRTVADSTFTAFLVEYGSTMLAQTGQC